MPRTRSLAWSELKIGVLTIVALIQSIFLWNELALAEILLVTPDRGTLPMGLIAFKSHC